MSLSRPLSVDCDTTDYRSNTDLTDYAFAFSRRTQLAQMSTGDAEALREASVQQSGHISLEAHLSFFYIVQTDVVATSRGAKCS